MAFLAPVLEKRVFVEAKVKDAVTRVCQDALTLNHLLASSQDHYSFFYPTNPTSFDKDTMSAESEEPGHGGGKGSDIVYCVFAGLSKRVAENPGKKICLEQLTVVKYS